MLNGDGITGVTDLVAVAMRPVFILAADAPVARNTLGAADLRIAAAGILDEKIPTPLPMAVLAMIGITMDAPNLTYSSVI